MIPQTNGWVWLVKHVLLGVSLLLIIGVICEMIQPRTEIFEACVTILPPIATFVIGYYFGKSS